MVPFSGSPLTPTANGKHNLDLRARQYSQLQETEEEQGQHGQHQHELDRGLAGLAPHLAAAIKWLKMASKNVATRPRPTQVTSARATAAAPSSTRAYSAVA